MLNEDKLTLFLTTLTLIKLSGLLKRQNKQFKIKLRKSHIQIKAIL